MIEIDGSIGYGQVLRTAIALSALTLKPIRIFNIRKGRPKPGLAAQHLTGVKVAGEFCDAEIKGLKIGSTEIEFIPKELNVTDRKIDIGTAGSIGLLLQTLTPIMIYADKSVTLEITGGTAGLGAPTIQYLKHVTYPILSKLGLKLPEIEIVKEGFYPKGQGLVRIRFEPIKKLNSVDLTEGGRINGISGISIAGSLPQHIAERQANTVKKILSNFDNVNLSSSTVTTASPGTSITLWAECENTILGSDKIGEKGIPAERIGEECAKELITSIDSGAALDKHMSDQILPFIALSRGISKIKVEEITQHCNTNMLVCEQLLGVKFDVNSSNKIISVTGTEFQR
jgi:RNA 3'-terminal phosphate cyclase (ATP)